MPYSAPPLRTIALRFVPLAGLIFSLILYSNSHTTSLHISAFTRPSTLDDNDETDDFNEQGTSGAHTYRPDGLLEVNPARTHPIFDLIDLAHARWKFKLARASTTLDEAVQEYVRRYNRRPPRGFDKWWDYVTAHNVQLPDEYDQIHRDLAPFWGYHPTYLQQLQASEELRADSFTLGKNASSESGGRVAVLRTAFRDAHGSSEWNPEKFLGGAYSIMEVLKEVEHDLPEFRAVVSPHDSPTLFADYEIKRAALDAADRGTYVDPDTLVPGEKLGWLSGCAPSSPARQAPAHPIPNPSTPAKNKTKTKTFIFDHRKSMDPCTHPTHLTHVGEFLAHPHPHPAPSPHLLPRFAYCATQMHHDIQVPTLSGWVRGPGTSKEDEEDEADPPWEARLDARLSWRGANTGMWHAPHTRWRDAQRARLVGLAGALNGSVRVLLPGAAGTGETGSGNRNDKRSGSGSWGGNGSGSARAARVGEGVEMKRALVNPAMMDVAFAGEPVGCHEETCGVLRREFEWRKRQDAREAGRFKYVIDVRSRSRAVQLGVLFNLT
ncbi:hypothetical protein H0H81_012270 [Sphagnurus paluster]|uniref:Uncharacterized protein n=1 Tax=Sphagnurus paluster TaxID=117069 RepID=A0A9P7FQI3_9AGAR|nr:hypothetical protein H0H81_012270 [Sphagnurus paluster]